MSQTEICIIRSVAMRGWMDDIYCKFRCKMGLGWQELVTTSPPLSLAYSVSDLESASIVDC